MRIYRCNNGDCRIESGELSSWLTIGSSDEKNNLYIMNNTSFCGLKEMGRHSDIHFCSVKCFIKFLFGSGLAVSPITEGKAEKK